MPKALEVYRKRIDHIGNDYYLGHIFRTLRWWTDPTHVSVLGDLVGSQWIDDAEFEERGERFWKRVFRGGERVEDGLAVQSSSDNEGGKGNIHVLGEDEAGWKSRIINIAGNHDIGYAGDLSPERMVRFERVFGKANYELRFALPSSSSISSPNSTFYPQSSTPAVDDSFKPIPELRIIVLNDMNLDSPASSSSLQDSTYNFLNNVITTSHPVARPALFTLLLTHIPLYKPSGICVDGPLFNFFEHFQYNNGIREQNHLSLDASRGILEGLFGMSGNPDADGHGKGRNGVILTGHDHEGCDVYHYINQSIPGPLAPEWEVVKTVHSQNLTTRSKETEIIPGLREITLRSMMGDFDGNAGLLSLWFDEEKWEWEMGFQNCEMGSQHGWWIVHVLDLITVVVMIVYSGLYLAFKEGVIRNGKQEVGKGEVNGVMGSGNENGKVVMNGNGNGSVKGLKKKKSRKALNGHAVNGNGNGNNGTKLNGMISEE